MPFASPNYSRRRVDAAGEHIRAGNYDQSDVDTLENWRAAHLYVINTFQSSLRGRRRRLGADISIAQRLKRRPTIIDKLTREPGMALSRMHDIAGCRIIFDSVDELRSFRSGVHNSRSNHELIGGDDRYDYMKSPKRSGYRGVHDVFKYDVKSVSGQPWNGLRIEIQYRTLVQHAWATAVEISDIVNSTRLKFGQAGAELEKLFLLASEILARANEGMTGNLRNTDTKELLQEYHDLERRLQAVAHLKHLTSADFKKFAQSSRLFILVNPIGETPGLNFFAVGFSDNRTAVSKYAEYEQQYQGKADVVLVGASEQDAIRLAYTNYFSDASDFLGYMDAALKRLA